MSAWVLCVCVSAWCVCTVYECMVCVSTVCECVVCVSTVDECVSTVCEYCG